MRQPVIPWGHQVDKASFIGLASCFFPFLSYLLSGVITRKCHRGPSFWLLIPGNPVCGSPDLSDPKAHTQELSSSTLGLNLQHSLTTWWDAHGLWHLDDLGLPPPDSLPPMLIFFEFTNHAPWLVLCTFFLSGECCPLFSIPSASFPGYLQLSC